MFITLLFESGTCHNNVVLDSKKLTSLLIVNMVFYLKVLKLC